MTLPVTYKFLLGSGFMISTCLPDLWPKMLIEKAAKFASPSRDIRFVARGKEKERERERHCPLQLKKEGGKEWVHV